MDGEGTGDREMVVLFGVRFIGVDNTIEIWAKEKAEQPFMNPEEFSEALQDILGESGMISD